MLRFIILTEFGVMIMGFTLLPSCFFQEISRNYDDVWSVFYLVQTAAEGEYLGREFSV